MPDTTYIISVSAGTGCYRHIQLSDRETLYTLHQAILKAFQFEEDALHIFFMDNRAGSIAHAFLGGFQWRETSDLKFPPEMDTKNITLEQAGVVAGKKFKYCFELERGHTFQCRVLREVQQDAPYPFVVRAVGMLPEQEPDEPGDVDEDGFPIIYREWRIQRMMNALPLFPETVHQLKTYFAAAKRLYGVIPLKKLLEIYNKQNQPVSQEDFLAFAEIIRHTQEQYFILGKEARGKDMPAAAPIERELIEQSLLMFGWDDYYELTEEQGDKPYYIPSRKEMLRYGEDDSYYPATTQRAAMERFLLQHGISQADTGTIMLVMLDLMAMDADLNYVIEQVREFGLQLKNVADQKAFAMRCAELSSNTRKAVNRGYTDVELYRLEKTDSRRPGKIIEFPRKSAAVAPAKIKVGRNEPCPCGSGKKYKKCCGR